MLRYLDDLNNQLQKNDLTYVNLKLKHLKLNGKMWKVAFYKINYLQYVKHNSVVKTSLYKLFKVM